MITYLKKRNRSKTPRAKNVHMAFRKPIIRIIDTNDTGSCVDNLTKDNIDKSIETSIDENELINSIKDNINDNIKGNIDVIDDIDDISINNSKISMITEKFKSKKGEIKKNIFSNAVLVKELLLKTVDKHKIELCTQMASQLVEVYNNKQSNISENTSNNDNNNNEHVSKNSSENNKQKN